jgi:dGTPase
MLPALVRERCGERRSRQLHAFITALVRAAAETGRVGMDPEHAAALAEFRRFNYDHIYMRPASVTQNRSVIRLLQALVEFHADRPNSIPRPAARAGLDPGSDHALREAVTYVGGMTDRYAFAQARALLGWRSAELPVGVG